MCFINSLAFVLEGRSISALHCLLEEQQWIREKNSEQEMENEEATVRVIFLLHISHSYLGKKTSIVLGRVTLEYSTSLCLNLYDL
jgi:hypothetical protein